MIEVYEGVYQGSDKDVDAFLEQHPNGWIIHAAKEPWHRNALGYVGRSAPKDHPDYLYAIRSTEHGYRMYLNFVDADDAKYIPKDMVDRALGFALRAVDHGHPLLIHCNQGKSRSVMLCALLEPWLDSIDPLPVFRGMGKGCADFYHNHYWGYALQATDGERP